ncbi:disulfide bond formation protein B [Magnetococcus sp. PR-3]|uniref:disulfide bond formation protein B n=1 Tax=Magnetococcus sp. PR-3 TaxID=3120355 RepID=UPI002FCE046B
MEMDKKNQVDKTITTGWLWLFAAWLVATLAMMGSLFFSEILDVPVCELCWYQRILLYPLVPILALGLFPHDRGVVRYASPLVFIGWGIAFYQFLLVMGGIPESIQPCKAGIPCSETHMKILGFINIPMLSLFTFTVLLVLLGMAHGKK